MTDTNAVIAVYDNHSAAEGMQHFRKELRKTMQTKRKTMIVIGGVGIGAGITNAFSNAAI